MHEIEGWRKLAKVAFMTISGKFALDYRPEHANGKKFARSQ
jgi:hypothetical protein